MQLIKLNKNQLRWVGGLFTWHCHLKVHLYKAELTNNPICVQFLNKDETTSNILILNKDKTTSHILCDCEAIAYLRSCHMGRYFREPCDYTDNPLNKVLHFVWSVGLLGGYTWRGTQQINKWSWCMGWWTYSLFIHSFHSIRPLHLSFHPFKVTYIFWMRELWKSLYINRGKPLNMVPYTGIEHLIL
jgi:hypothetical protein